jgi:hypothetical protein
VDALSLAQAKKEVGQTSRNIPEHQVFDPALDLS